MTPYEKIRGQKYRKEILPLGEQVLARRRGANVNQLVQPWVTGLWLGRDTLSDEHLIGTAAGVMRSRAVPRLQEPARWVPAALNAMLFTPWSPHLNLRGRPHLQRPTYEEPIEAGTLPRFIEIPTAPTKNTMSETATSTPDDTGQSTKRRTSGGNISRTVANILVRRCSRQDSHRLVNGDSWSTQIPNPSTTIISRRKRQYPKTSETIRGEHSVSPCRW